MLLDVIIHPYGSHRGHLRNAAAIVSNVIIAMMMACMQMVSSVMCAIPASPKWYIHGCRWGPQEEDTQKYKRKQKLYLSDRVGTSHA